MLLPVSPALMDTSIYDLLAVASLTFHELDLSTYGGRTFCHAGPSSWSALPDCLNNNALSLSNFIGTSRNVSTSHPTCIPSALEVFFRVNALYQFPTCLLLSE